jgi:hypothetical protein
MTTPKEKAKELVDRFIQQTRNKWEKSMSYRRAKDCALIAIQMSIEELDDYNRHGGLQSRINFWQEVKKEIEKL